MASTGVTGSNPHPNRPSDLTPQIQKNINEKEAKWNKARGGEKGRTMGNVKRLTSLPPIRMPGGGFQK